MADVGLAVSPGAAGRPARGRAPAGRDGLGAVGARRRRPGPQVGLDRADVGVALTDGGAGREEVPRVSSPRAERVRDFVPAAEPLNDLAKALHPDAAQAREAAGRWCHTLKHAGGAARPAAPEGLDRRGRPAAAREADRREAGYGRDNVPRMDDPRSRANGRRIGSGHVEAACPAVVGQRLKGGGLRRGEAGADAVCHPRARFKSEKGQWDAVWANAA
jgi:hypothetical protein